mmetsp:Transcript_8459/g.17199  ORF Transcript_8459/g.17199 Transcript_8459/m.17199 type:complete len:256 (-) Transcript_8459:49-816(-)
MHAFCFLFYKEKDHGTLLPPVPFFSQLRRHHTLKGESDAGPALGDACKCGDEPNDKAEGEEDEDHDAQPELLQQEHLGPLPGLHGRLGVEVGGKEEDDRCRRKGRYDSLHVCKEGDEVAHHIRAHEEGRRDPKVNGGRLHAARVQRLFRNGFVHLVDQRLAGDDVSHQNVKCDQNGTDCSQPVLWERVQNEAVDILTSVGVRDERCEEVEEAHDHLRRQKAWDSKVPGILHLSSHFVEHGLALEGEDDVGQVRVA